MMSFLHCVLACAVSQLNAVKEQAVGTPTSMATQARIMRLIAENLSQGTNSVKADQQAAGIKYQLPQ